MRNFVNRILSNKSLKYKITLVITLVGLLTIVSGGSYAILKGSVSSTNEQVIEVGKVKILLTENFDNIDGDALIMDDVSALLSEDIYDFSIKNIGDSSAMIDVKLLNEAPSGFSGDVLDDSYIKVGLEVNGEEMGPMNLEDVENVIDSNIINKDEIINYKLRVWLDATKKAQLRNLSDSKMFLKLGVDATQRVKEKNVKLRAADTLISKVGECGLTKITHEADSTLQIGATEAIEEYRYVGPNSTVSCNYATFNNETYRIIGVFPTDDGAGKIENRIKLIKASSIGTMDWDESGTNNWTNATLNTYLNGTFYNSLDSSSQNLIGNAKYYLGGYNSAEVTKDLMYSYERKTSGSSYYYSSNPTNWTGKVGLMYASDYGYAVSSACTQTLYGYNNTMCKSNNWLRLNKREWFLPPRAANSVGAFFVFSDGDVDFGYVDSFQSEVRPVLYLISAAEITGGDGTSGNPYTFG